MSSFLLVHGGWGGSWQWEEIGPELINMGHTIHTPDLPGMDDSGLKKISLEDHISFLDEIIIESKEKLLLTAFSFGGLASTAAAARHPEKIKKIIYLDAFIPLPGENFIDIVGHKMANKIMSIRGQFKDKGKFPPIMPSDDRYRGHPFQTIFGKVNYKSADLLKLRPYYIHFTKKNPQWSFYDILEYQYKKSLEIGMSSRDVDTDHVLPGTRGKEIAAILNEIAAVD